MRRYDPFCFATEQEWEALQRGQGELRWRGKAVRWVGNEDGVGREDEWSVQPVFHRELGSDATLPDLGQELSQVVRRERCAISIIHPLEEAQS